MTDCGGEGVKKPARHPSRQTEVADNVTLREQSYCEFNRILQFELEVPNGSHVQVLWLYQVRRVLPV